MGSGNWPPEKCVLHVSGGDPKPPLDEESIKKCSPRKWR